MTLTDNFQDQMKRELSYREEMVQQLQIVRGNADFALLTKKGQFRKSNTCIFSEGLNLKENIRSQTFHVCDPTQMIYSFFFLFYLDTLCNELDQERKARYAIQQKLKGNLEIQATIHYHPLKWNEKDFFTLFKENYKRNMQVLLFKRITQGT